MDLTTTWDKSVRLGMTISARSSFEGGIGRMNSTPVEADILESAFSEIGLKIDRTDEWLIGGRPEGSSIVIIVGTKANAEFDAEREDKRQQSLIEARERLASLKKTGR
jgi:hypothetical protein